MMRRLLFLGTALMVGTAAASVAASPVVPVVAMQGAGAPMSNDDKRALAKKYFDEGAALYTQGSYEEAVGAWEKAFELSEEPLIFENMANAYERLGELEKAREHLQLWRDAAPAAEHPLLDKRLANLDERIAEQKRDAAAKEPSESEDTKKPKKPKKVEGSSVSIPGLILTGVGVAAVGGGIAVGAVGASQRPDESDVCGEANSKSLCLESSRDDIDTSTTLAAVGDLMWIAGAVTGTVGIVLLITHEPSTGPAVGTVLRPRVTASDAGLVLEGTF